MSLSTEQIEIILLAGSGSCHKVAKEFNRRHPLSTPIMHDSVVKLIEEFLKTGSVAD